MVRPTLAHQGGASHLTGRAHGGSHGISDRAVASRDPARAENPHGPSGAPSRRSLRRWGPCHTFARSRLKFITHKFPEPEGPMPTAERGS